MDEQHVARPLQSAALVGWRLLALVYDLFRVVAADGGRPNLAALCRRYAVGSLSLVLGGAGFWWAWIDRERLTLHDRVSRTRLVRLPKAVSPNAE
jgi:uncharacterized RDD family membrane protein YckC